MTNPIQFVARNQIEDSFRKKRLITIPKEKPMTGPKPNTKAVRDAIYNWLTPEVLYSTYKKNTIDTVRRTIKAIILQYLKEGVWAVIPKSMPYNTQGSVMVIEESFEFLSDLYQGDIKKMFSIEVTKTKNTTKAIRKIETEPTELKTQPFNIILGTLLNDINKYELSKEQIITAIKGIIKEEIK